MTVVNKVHIQAWISLQPASYIVTHNHPYISSCKPDLLISTVSTTAYMYFHWWSNFMGILAHKNQNKILYTAIMVHTIIYCINPREDGTALSQSMVIHIQKARFPQHYNHQKRIIILTRFRNGKHWNMCQFRWQVSNDWPCFQQPLHICRECFVAPLNKQVYLTLLLPICHKRGSHACKSSFCTCWSCSWWKKFHCVKFFCGVKFSWVPWTMRNTHEILAPWKFYSLTTKIIKSLLWTWWCVANCFDSAISWLLSFLPPTSCESSCPGFRGTRFMIGQSKLCLVRVLLDPLAVSWPCSLTTRYVCT